MTRQQMERDLEKWNPHWNRETIRGWNDIQLKKIHSKEQQKIVKNIRLSLGLAN